MKALFLVLLFVAFASSTLVPAHVVLTLTGVETSIQVSFSTSTKPATSSVSFWPSSAPSKIVEVVATAADIHTFAHPSGDTTEYITSITMTSLSLATSYSYYVNGESKDNSTQSATHEFRTLPEDTSTLNIGIYGDLGAYGTAIVEKGNGGLLYWTQNHKFDFIMHNGDLAYNLDTAGEEFLANVEAVTSTTPYVVTPGNHEFMGSSESYYNNWFLGQTTLGESSSSTDPIMYYSFDIGTKLHIVVISTEVYCEDHTHLVDQHEWLAKDLAAVRARSVQPWILAFGHRQIYIATTSTLHSRLMRLGLKCNDSTLQHCDYTASCDDGRNCGYSIQSLFEQYKVDMYFAGHVHTYNRMFPIASNLTFETQDVDQYINPQHTVYVVSGAAGTQSSPSEELQEGAPLASPTAVSVSGYSFSLLQVFNDTHISLEQNDVETGKIVDTFWVVKDSSRPAWTKTTDLSLAADSQTACDQ